MHLRPHIRWQRPVNLDLPNCSEANLWLVVMEPLTWDSVKCGLTDLNERWDMAFILPLLHNKYNIILLIFWPQWSRNGYLGVIGLIPLVPRLEYSGKTSSIPWMLMTWRLESPGHQQPWYWLCRINRSLTFMRKDFNYLHHLDVEKWLKIKTYFLCSQDVKG